MIELPPSEFPAGLGAALENLDGCPRRRGAESGNRDREQAGWFRLWGILQQLLPVIPDEEKERPGFPPNFQKMWKMFPVEHFRRDKNSPDLFWMKRGSGCEKGVGQMGRSF